MTHDYRCWRLTLFTSDGREHILFGSEKDAIDAVEMIKGLPKGTIVDWGDNAVRVEMIKDYRIENIGFGEVYA